MLRPTNGSTPGLDQHATILIDALPIVVAAGFVVILLIGFWRGLSLRPNRDGNKAPPASKYFWWSND